MMKYKPRRKPPLSPEEIARLRAKPGMRVHDAQRVYPFGRNKLYDLMHAGLLPFTKIGSTTIISTAGLEALVAPKAMTSRGDATMMETTMNISLPPWALAQFEARAKLYGWSIAELIEF